MMSAMGTIYFAYSFTKYTTYVVYLAWQPLCIANKREMRNRNWKVQTQVTHSKQNNVENERRLNVGATVVHILTDCLPFSVTYWQSLTLFLFKNTTQRAERSNGVHFPPTSYSRVFLQSRWFTLLTGTKPLYWDAVSAIH